MHKKIICLLSIVSLLLILGASVRNVAASTTFSGWNFNVGDKLEYSYSCSGSSCEYSSLTWSIVITAVSPGSHVAFDMTYSAGSSTRSFSGNAYYSAVNATGNRSKCTGSYFDSANAYLAQFLFYPSTDTDELSAKPGFAGMIVESGKVHSADGHFEVDWNSNGQMTSFHDKEATWEVTISIPQSTPGYDTRFVFLLSIVAMLAIVVKIVARRTRIRD